MANPDAPEPKRTKRTHSEFLSESVGSNGIVTTVGAQRHQDLYFKDGNIVFIADGTYFKVHMGILSRHSTVFDDMLSIPQTPNSTFTLTTGPYDSCPLVRLSDSKEDLGYILSAMYDGIKNGNTEPQPISFAKASAFLRLGDKYNIASLQDQATRRFKSFFPSTLEGFDKLYDAYNKLNLFSDTDVDIASSPVVEADNTQDLLLSVGRQDFISMINLFRNHGLRDQLPLVFYFCAQLPVSALVDAHTRGELMSEDFKCCLRGRDALAGVGSLIMRLAASEFHSCGICFEAVRSTGIYEDIAYESYRSVLAPFSSSNLGVKLKNVQFNGHIKCKLYMVGIYEFWRCRTWNKLEDTFGLKDLPHSS